MVGRGGGFGVGSAGSAGVGSGRGIESVVVASARRWHRLVGGGLGGGMGRGVRRRLGRRRQLGRWRRAGTATEAEARGGEEAGEGWTAEGDGNTFKRSSRHISEGKS